MKHQVGKAPEGVSRAGGLPAEVSTWTPGDVPPPTGVVPIGAPSAERVALARLPGVEAPTAMLSDLVDELFLELRARAAREIGWDALARLENAVVGINAPMPPGFWAWAMICKASVVLPDDSGP